MKDNRPFLGRRDPAAPLNTLMDNVLASRLGEAHRLAGAMSAGDLIDRGLGLLIKLNEQGFDVVVKLPPVEGGGDAESESQVDVDVCVYLNCGEAATAGSMCEGHRALFTDGAPWVVEGARVALVTCKLCGAALLLDPRDTFSVMQLHLAWHGTFEDLEL